MTTSATDKKHLRRLGHNLKPVVTIATKGLTDTVNAEIDRALNKIILIALLMRLKKNWVALTYSLIMLA